jgi:hypothetical protein
MPTLEVQLTKAQKDLAALEEVMNTGSRWMVNGHYYWPPKRVDQQHGNEAELRGLRERVRHLQRRIEIRNEQAERRASAQALIQAAEKWIQMYEPSVLTSSLSQPNDPPQEILVPMVPEPQQAEQQGYQVEGNGKDILC